MTVDRSFWSGARVLVTGHTGFKGTWLTTWLVEMGATVVGLSDGLPTKPSMYALCGPTADVEERRGDVRDPGFVHDVVSSSRPDVVFHLAAQAVVRASYTDPVATYATNVMGTVNVLEAVRAARVPVTVVVTSDKCYENREWTWGYREIDRLGGRDPYSSSKACAELVTAAYRSSFLAGESDVRLATARAGNVIGGGDWSADRLVPDLVRGALDGTVVRIRQPDAVRPWQHVIDCLSGYLRLAERIWTEPTLQGAWNFGPDAADQRSVREFVELLRARWPDDLEVAMERDVEQPHEAGLLALDCTAARQQLGWAPRWAVEQAIGLLVDWYEGHRNGRDMRELTLHQLERWTTFP